MLSFKQYLEEGRISEIIHTNPSVDTLKAIARNNKHGSARFVVYNTGEILAGDSLKFIHHDLEPDTSKLVLRGYVDHHKATDGSDKYFYTSMNPSMNVSTDNHEYLERLRKKGIESGNNPTFEG